VKIKGKSLLHIAIMAASEKVVEFLTSLRNFDPATSDVQSILQASLSARRENSRGGAAPLELAVRLPGADVNGIFDDGTTLLTSALMRWESVNRVSEFAVRSDHDQSRVMNAMHNVTFLLSLPGVDVNRRDASGRFPLFLALDLPVGPRPDPWTTRADVDWNIRDPETLDTPLIVMAKARMDPTDNSGKSRKEWLPAWREVVANAAVDVNAQNKKGNTAAIEAVIAGNAAGFRVLASRADVRFDIVNIEGKDIASIAEVSVAPNLERSKFVSIIVEKIEKKAPKVRSGLQALVKPSAFDIGFKV